MVVAVVGGDAGRVVVSDRGTVVVDVGCPRWCGRVVVVTGGEIDVLPNGDFMVGPTVGRWVAQTIPTTLAATMTSEAAHPHLEVGRFPAGDVTSPTVVLSELQRTEAAP